MNLNRLFDSLERFTAPLVRPISARLNPIMVKEVRQALRGHYFQWSFFIVTLVATITGCALLFNFASYSDSQGGIAFFLAMFGILSAAVNILVPFHAFNSVGAEWDENTYDLLVLSELTPLQIAKGKLLSALVQALLFYVAFAPFLVFSFLLRGLDLASGTWALGSCLVYSCLLCALAICLSSLVTGKFARVLLMAILVALLGMGCIGSIGLATMVLEERLVHQTEFLQGTGFTLCLALLLGAFLMLLAAARFTHAEENRSTGLRVLVSLMTLIAGAWMGYFYYAFGDLEILHFGSLTAFIALTVFGIFFCAEAECLGRRVALGVPRSPWACLLVQPFMPGGARGVLHYFLNLGMLLGIAVLMPMLSSKSAFGIGSGAGFFSARWVNISMGMLPYLICYLLIPTGIFARWSGKLRSRILARLCVPLFFAFSIMIPAVLYFLVTGSDESFKHLANPFSTIDDSPSASYGDLWYVALFALLVSLLNLPRILRSFGELEAARKRRLEREAASSLLDRAAGGGGAPGSDAYAGS